VHTREIQEIDRKKKEKNNHKEKMVDFGDGLRLSIRPQNEGRKGEQERTGQGRNKEAYLEEWKRSDAGKTGTWSQTLQDAVLGATPGIVAKKWK